MLGDLGASAMQFSYSRDAEREADQIAVKLLREAGISSKPFAGFFKKLDPSTKSEKPPTPAASSGRFGGIKDVFSTHPNPAERMATIEALPDYPATPALADADWKALQMICGVKPKPEVAPGAKPATSSPQPTVKP
jgi:predicted Zn-dependent protease